MAKGRGTRLWNFHGTKNEVSWATRQRLKEVNHPHKPATPLSTRTLTRAHSFINEECFLDQSEILLIPCELYFNSVVQVGVRAVCLYKHVAATP
jgi:hypothetical protein